MFIDFLQSQACLGVYESFLLQPKTEKYEKKKHIYIYNQYIYNQYIYIYISTSQKKNCHKPAQETNPQETKANATLAPNDERKYYI